MFWLYSYKWHDSKSIRILANNIKGANGTSTVIYWIKGGAIKVSYPILVKLHNHGIRRVDLIDAKTPAYLIH